MVGSAVSSAGQVHYVGDHRLGRGVNRSAAPEPLDHIVVARPPNHMGDAPNLGLDKGFPERDFERIDALVWLTRPCYLFRAWRGIGFGLRWGRAVHQQEYGRCNPLSA